MPISSDDLQGCFVCIVCFFFNLFIYLLLPVDDPEFIRTGSRIPG